MRISASVRNTASGHEVAVATAGTPRSLNVPAKAGGAGSAVNGGEFLMLALATCYCNDLYREAQRLGLVIDGVEVEAAADFEARGLAARNVTYRARVTSNEAPERIEQLLRETDAVAEVHNTLRSPVAVELQRWTA